MNDSEFPREAWRGQRSTPDRALSDIVLKTRDMEYGGRKLDNLLVLFGDDVLAELSDACCYPALASENRVLDHDAKIGGVSAIHLPAMRGWAVVDRADQPNTEETGPHMLAFKTIGSVIIVVILVMMAKGCQECRATGGQYVQGFYKMECIKRT